MEYILIYYHTYISSLRAVSIHNKIKQTKPLLHASPFLKSNP